MATAQFLNVSSSETIPLEAFVPTGDNTSDNVAIQTLDAAGYTVDNYLWNDWIAETPCWVNDSFEVVEGVSFAPGQGLWVYGSSADQGIQSAGKVGTIDVSVQLRNGGTVTGNPFPISVALQDIIALGDDTSDNVAIQTLDAAGYTVDNYLWNDWIAETPCWVNDSFEVVEDVTFEPGQGLWVYGSSNAQYLQFPAPEL